MVDQGDTIPSNCFKGIVLCTLFIVTGFLNLVFSPSPLIAWSLIAAGIILFVAIVVVCRRRIGGWLATITGSDESP